MERPPSITSVTEEVYDLADVLEKPKRPAEWTVTRRSPILNLPEDSRFPVLPPTQSASAPRMSHGLRLKRVLMECKEAAEGQGQHCVRRGQGLLPLFDITAREEAQRNAQIIAAAPPPRTPTPPPTWKEERELRIQNAMARVQQSYVSNVKNLFAPDPHSEDEQLRYTPTFLDPIDTKKQVIWDEDRLKRNRRVTERLQKSHVDSSRQPNPPKMCSRREIEIDEKRQELLEKRRKQKEEKASQKHLSPPSHTQYDAIQPHAPHIPTPPSVCHNAERSDNYSKRKRKLRAGQPIDATQICSADMVPTPPTAPNKCAHLYDTTMINDGHPSTRDVEAQQKAKLQDTTKQNGETAAHPPLIPRQIATNIRSWNSDTAKRGLGFKSKLRRESEQASSTSNIQVTQSKSESIPPQVRQKWKKATFY